MAGASTAGRSDKLLVSPRNYMVLLPGATSLERCVAKCSSAIALRSVHLDLERTFNKQENFFNKQETSLPNISLYDLSTRASTIFLFVKAIPELESL